MMTLIRKILLPACLLLAGTLFTTAGCKNKQNDSTSGPSQPATAGSARVWLTRGDQSKLLHREGDLTIQTDSNTSWPMISLDTTRQMQVIEGFGAALTGSSAYLLKEKMSDAARLLVLKQLFDPDTGIGISYLRLTIGASDFSSSDFSLDDPPAGVNDFTLQYFSFANGDTEVIPVLKEILQIEPSIGLIGSPWSPPAWMKTNGDMEGGKLRTDCYDVYADYFIRYIQELKSQGINLTAITLQNEPLYYTANYPCMEMEAADQLNFIKNHLGPKFASTGITTKIFIYDHNWDVTDYAISILNDPGASQYVTGTAFHGYGGDVSAMSTVHNAHPEKDLYFTEISGGTWGPNFSDNLMWFTNTILIGTTLNWSKNALFWNLMLDPYGGPHNNGCSTCRGVVTLNKESGQVIYNEEYYAIGHFSKFVRPGAHRIAFSLPAGLYGIQAVAFVNPNGSKAFIVCNSDKDYKTFTVKQGKKSFNYSLSPKSVVTFTW